MSSWRISIYPTVNFLSWRKVLKQDQSPDVDAQSVTRLRYLVRLELGLLLILPLLAVLMARLHWHHVVVIIGSLTMKEPSTLHVPENRGHQEIGETLGNDYTGIAILVGALTIATAFVFMWFSVTFPFSITALVWGSIIVCASLFFRHKAMDKRARYQEAVLKLERERVTSSHKQVMLQSVLDHGLPEGVSWEQLQALLNTPAQTSTEEKASEPS